MHIHSRKQLPKLPRRAFESHQRRCKDKSCCMASFTQSSTPENQQQQQQKLQIYSSTKTGVSPFWREKYERDARKYWDIFYKRHQDKFFKDRHYLDKEWGQYFAGSERKVVLEVGCGAGNTIFPLLAAYPDSFFYACDFSPRAVDLVKTHTDYSESRISAFVCDLTVDDLSKEIPPSSVDIVTMIFVLSAVSPEKMPLVLHNIKKVLKPNGHILLRDYALGDLAQERFTSKDQKISENFYVRGDGTRAFYFSNDYLMNLFKDTGFDVTEIGVCCKQVENRARELVMNRRWIQAILQLSSVSNSSCDKSSMVEKDLVGQVVEPKVKRSTSDEPGNNYEIDISEGLAADMFDTSVSSENEAIEVKVKDHSFKINVLSKENQHTCKSTGLMLWESAHMMASLLARNPAIVDGKKLAEIGCGSSGICSMVVVEKAKLVVATDGDIKVLDLLNENIAANLKAPALEKLIIKRLEWGNEEHIKAIKELNCEGFDVIIGTDVTYIPEAILPLFKTAKDLISKDKKLGGGSGPALILCHVLRWVDEPSILAAASQFGFRLVDNWAMGKRSLVPFKGVIESWFPKDGSEDWIPCTALNIMYFNVES